MTCNNYLALVYIARAIEEPSHNTLYARIEYCVNWPTVLCTHNTNRVSACIIAREEGNLLLLCIGVCVCV